MLKLGAIICLELGVEDGMKMHKDLGLPLVQIIDWDPACITDKNANLILQSAKENGVEIASFWGGYPGPAVWNFTEGPSTIGLVPPEWRQIRVDALKKGADFAVAIGAPMLITHAGFLPENPADPLYKGTIEALTEVAVHCKNLGIDFCFETGQETPTTLLRMITDVGTDNLGINLDPANLLMYGKANPVDALDTIGKYVKSVHAKDGEYPTMPNELGVEKALGEGRVHFELLIPKLKSMGYTGALIIEREISGEQQIVDIKKAIDLLQPLC